MDKDQIAHDLFLDILWVGNKNRKGFSYAFQKVMLVCNLNVVVFMKSYLEIVLENRRVFFPSCLLKFGGGNKLVG